MGSRNDKFKLPLTNPLGTGQPWWDAFKADETVLRPVLFGTEGLKGGSMSGINMKNSPNWFNIISDTTNFAISDMKLWNEETNEEAPPKVCCSCHVLLPCLCYEHRELIWCRIRMGGIHTGAPIS